MTTTTPQEAGPALPSTLLTELGGRVMRALHAENKPRAPGSPYTASAANVIAMRAQDALPSWWRQRRTYGEELPARPVPAGQAVTTSAPIVWPAGTGPVTGQFTDHWVRETKVRPSLTFEGAAPNHDGVLTIPAPTQVTKARTSKGRTPKKPRFQITITFGGSL
jgi:hypothetical protein